MDPMARFLFLVTLVLFYGAIAGAIFGLVYAAARLAFTHALRKHGILVAPKDGDHLVRNDPDQAGQQTGVGGSQI
jgi:hypothetical protein